MVHCHTRWNADPILPPLANQPKLLRNKQQQLLNTKEKKTTNCPLHPSELHPASSFSKKQEKRWHCKMSYTNFAVPGACSANPRGQSTYRNQILRFPAPCSRSQQLSWRQPAPPPRDPHPFSNQVSEPLRGALQHFPLKPGQGKAHQQHDTTQCLLWKRNTQCKFRATNSTKETQVPANYFPAYVAELQTISREKMVNVIFLVSDICSF